MNYKKITLDSKEILDYYININHLLTSDYSLSVILTWKDLQEPEIAEYKNILYIRGMLSGERVYFPPLTVNRFKEAVNTLEDYTKSINENLMIILALQEQIKKLDKNKYNFVTNRDYAEYVYLSKDLIKLTGKKFHSKRNHINKFNKSYNYNFRSYKESDYDKVIEQLYKWANERGEDPNIELDLVKYWLKHIKELELFADVIEIDDKIAATTIGECSNRKMGIVLYEKCDFSYDGICSAVNQMFAEKHFVDIKYINRQEDMGIDGLRRAKMSYNPYRLIYRWTIERKE